MVRRRVLAACALGCLLGAGLSLPVVLDWRINRVAAAPRTAPLWPAAKALHASLWLADLHADTLLWNRDLNLESARGHVDLPRMVRGNVALQAFSVVTKTPHGLNIEHNDDTSDNITALSVVQRLPRATWHSLMARATYHAGRLHAFADASGGRFRVIDSAAGLRAFVAERRRQPTLAAGWLTLEGAHALEGKLSNLDVLYRAGYRMAAPTHFFDTELSGSQHGMRQGGLTALGRDWVRAMESRHMIIDLAHASEATIDQVLAMATRPLMVSHTGVRGTCANRRNLTDEQLKQIAARGGLIGIGFWNTAVCGADVAAVSRAIAYTVALVGERHVAYGSDFDGAVVTAIDAAHLAELTQALMEAGLTNAQIERIAGRNVLEFLLQNLPES
ncbi:MAG: membrane dipeptidase [Pseudomonadota bacterium]